MAWTITGEAGKTLDETSRTFPALGIASWALKHKPFGEDSFVWTAKLDNATGAGTIIPQAGQVVEVWLDGVRKFRGHAGKPKVGLASVTVTIEGPFWWMSRIDLTGNQVDGTGATAERASYVFPTQALKTSIETLIARMVTLGVPIQLGTVGATYSGVKITLANINCGAALAEFLLWLPDAVAWVDYSVVGLPALNVTRRGDMVAVTYTVASDRVEASEILPRLDLEVLRSELNYVTRQASTGLPQWAVQSYGAAAVDAIGKRQIVTISGPEIVDFLPRDDFDSVTVQTGPAAVSAAYVATADSTLASIGKQFGAAAVLSLGAITNDVVTYQGQTGSNYYGIPVHHYFPGLAYQKDDGTYLSSVAGKYLVISGSLPEWAMTALSGIAVTITGTWVSFWKDSVQGAGTQWSSLYQALQAGSTLGSGWERAPIGATDVVPIMDWAARPFSIRGVLIPTAYVAATVIYKPWDYDYLTPPAGLAQGLRDAQNWVPYEGPITIVGDGVTGDNMLGSKFNLANSLTEHATMAALARSVTQDSRGRTIIDLGAPARTDFGSLVSRIRRDPKDNIVYL